MGQAIRLRAVREDERGTIERLAPARTAAARRVERAQIRPVAGRGQRGSALAQTVRVGHETVRFWRTRFHAAGLASLADAPRSGRPATSTPAPVGAVVASALPDPPTLGVPLGGWTLDRLERHAACRSRAAAATTG